MKALILSLCLIITFNVSSKTIVISDIDDTIKTSNSMGILGQVYHFLQMGSYQAMSLIYQDISRHYFSGGVEFIYVSAAPDAIYDQDRWLLSKNFPQGKSYLRDSILEDTYDYKMETIRKLIRERDVKARFIFFGDNSSKDAVVYRDIVEEFKIERYSIYIRDVATTETFVNKTIVNSFFTELDLLDEFSFLRPQTRYYIQQKARRRELLPPYTVHTLKRALRDGDLCRGGCYYANELIEEYYLGF